MIDSTKFFQLVREHAQEGKPFVIYRKPAEIEVNALLQWDKTAHKAKDHTESGFVFARFNSKNDSFLIPSDNSDQYKFEYQAEGSLDDRDPDDVTGNFDFELMEEDQKQHENLVQKGIDAIKQGDLKKVVLSRSEKVELYDPDALRIFKNLLHKYPQAFVYIWFHPETGYWLGATPETLLSTERTKFKTMALAGTQLYKGKIDVTWGRKEAEEQQFVTDYILDSLNSIESIEAISVSDAYSARAGNLLHICTDITGRLTSLDHLSELIYTLHPTPAVCGLPRQKALDFILNNEAYSREFYAGYLGELNLKTESKRNSNRKNQENQQFASISKKTALFVNLRCMKIKDGNARVFVGGGITADSNATDEWMETVNKSQTMKAVLVK